MAAKRKTTTNALEIIDRRHFRGRPQMERLLDQARERLKVSEQLYYLRQAQGLTQGELAERAKTSRTVITRLENSNYDRHTLSTLCKVAGAMGHEVHIHFVPKKPVPAAKRPRKTTPASTRP